METHYPSIGAYFASNEWQGLFYAFTEPFLPYLIGPWVRVPITVVLMGTAAYLTLRRRRQVRIPFELAIMTVAVGAHVVFMQLVYRELRVNTSYYFAPATLWFWIVAARFLPGALSPRAVATVAVAGAVGSAGLWMIFRPAPRPYWTERLALAHEIAERVLEDERVGAFWPGTFGQFGGRPVVPMDGIIGSEAFFREYVITSRQFDYLAERSIRYVAIFLDEPPERLFARTSVHPQTWNQLGQKRLWEARQRVDEVVSVRALSDRGDGWYLIRRSDARSQTPPAVRSRPG